MIDCRSWPADLAEILEHSSHCTANQLIELSVARAERLCQYGAPAKDASELAKTSGLDLHRPNQQSRDAPLAPGTIKSRGFFPSCPVEVRI
jgi:hypothetical protein